MSAPSSSMVRLLEETCPRALDLAEDGAPRDVRVFAAGTAAHAILEDWHKASIAAQRPLTQQETGEVVARTIAALTIEGRTFRGNREPALPADRVLEGADLAQGYLRAVDYILPIGALPEHDLTVNHRWEPCRPDDPDALWRATVDRVALEEDEDGERVIVVSDYKTAWSDRENKIESLQLRGQLLVVFAHAPDLWADAYPTLGRREIINLRTHGIYAETIELSDPALDDWRAQIAGISAAFPRRPKRGHRDALPGFHCAACPYRKVCPASRYGDAESLSAQIEDLTDALKTAKADEPAASPGYQPTAKREPSPTAAIELLARAAPELRDERVNSLINDLLSVTGIKRAAKRLAEPGEDPDAIAEQLLVVSRAARWTTP